MLRDLFLLVKIQLREMFAATRRKSRGGRRSRGGTAVLMAVLTLFVLGMMLVMYFGLQEALPREALFAVGLQMCTMLVLVLSIYQLPGFLFSFADRDLLAALPIKNSVVLASKLFAFYLSSLGICAVFTLPLWVVLLLGGAGAGFLPAAILEFFFIPLLPMVAGALLAFLLARLAAKLRMKNLVMIVGTVLIMVVSFSFSFSLQRLDTADGIARTGGILAVMSKVNFLTDFYLAGIAGSWGHVGLYALCALGLYGLFVLIFARGYQRLSGAVQVLGSRRVRGGLAMRVRSPRAALFHKELRSYFGSYAYVLNTIIGPVIALIGAIALLFVPLGGIPRDLLERLVLPLGALILAFLIGVSNLCAPCISVEGSRLWVLRSLPVSARDVLVAKLRLDLLVMLPPLLLAVAIAGLAVRAPLLDALLLAAFTAVFTVMMGLFGITYNLHHPRLDYRNEMTAVKQSTSVLLTMLTGMAFSLTLIPALIFLWLAQWIIIALTLVFALVALLLWLHVRGRGVAIFEQL